MQGVWLRVRLGYGWVGCMGWGKRVGMRAGWTGIGVGLGYGWVGVRDGVGQEGRQGLGWFGGEDRKWGNVTKDFSKVEMD